MKTKIAVVLTTLIAAPLLAQSPRSTIKAIVVHEFGGPEVLKYEDVPKPEPKENEILVRVIAAGVNPVDDGLRSGHYSKYFGPKPPFTPGGDTAGVVEKIGAKITMNETTQKLEDATKDVDIMLDCVGKDTLQRSYGVVKKGGFLVTIVARTESAELEKHGIHGSSLSVAPNSHKLTEITKL